MATKRINSNRTQVENARQLLLAAIFSESGASRLAAKQAVKQLLGPIIAARNAGLSFDEIAEKFALAGLELAPSTLRQYFFEQKAEEEQTRQSLKNAQRIAHVKAVLEDKANQVYGEQSFDVALSHAKRLNSQVVTPDFLSSAHVEVAVPMPPTVVVKPEEEGAKTVRPKPEVRKPEIQLPPAVQISPASLPVATPSVEHQLPDPDGAGMTLDELQEALSLPGETTELTEDLILRNGRVYWASSMRPFKGKLTRAHFSVLKAKGRLIAPTKGRSSGDFVNMRTSL